MKKYASHTYWIFISAVLIGFFIRFWASMHQPIFGDEAYSIYESQFYPFPYDPSYPPLYPIFLHYWVQISDNLLWVRLPSVIAGTLSLIIFWNMLYKKIHKYTADIGVALLALSSLHIHYSWVARPHSFAMLATCISLTYLWDIADSLKQKRLPQKRLLFFYLSINTIGALLSHGYTMFLMGSLLTLGIWAYKNDIWIPFIKSATNTYFLGAHMILPIIQFSFISKGLQPLIDSAEWIPDFNIHSITSVFLTLFNGTKVLTGDLYTSTLIAVYLSLAVVCIMIHMLYKNMRLHSPFIASLFVHSIAMSLLSVMVVYVWLNMTILQPRLLLHIHIFYIMGLAIILSTFINFIRHKKRYISSLNMYEGIFLIVFLTFSIRSLLLLNIYPYYTPFEVVKTIRQLQNDQSSTLLIFPRYQVLTIQYLWGLYTYHPTLAIAHFLLNLEDDAPISKYLDTIPLHTPISIILWADTSSLSAGAQAIISHIEHTCSRTPIGKEAELLHCPPLDHKL